MKLISIRQFLVSTVSVAILATPAMAFDGQDLLNKINAAYKLQGLELVVKSVDVDGDSVTMSEAGIVYSDESQSVIPLGDITLDGVTSKDGGYHIESIAFEDIDFADGETRILATDLAMENVIVPAYATAATIDGMLFYENASASNIEFFAGDTSFLTIDSVTASMNRDDAAGKLTGRVNLSDFSIDVSDIEDPASAETLNKLQMEIINGSFTAGGSWNTKTGELDIEDIKLSLVNIGTLSASFSITGYTMQFVEGLQQVAKEQAENASNPDAAAMAGLSMLGLAEALGIKGALIRFEDDSITERLISYMAETQGVSSTEFKTMLKAIVPMYVSQLGAPNLQQAIVKAVNIYLDNPETFSIAAKPQAPVTSTEILGAALGNPASLADVLGVSVEANN